MRLSRPCYDKPHRCPGWAGGGNRFPSEKGEAKYGSCNNGSIRTFGGKWHASDEYIPEGYLDDYPGSNPWRFGRCQNPECKVVTWPYVVRWIDPSYLISWARWKLSRLWFR